MALVGNLLAVVGYVVGALSICLLADRLMRAPHLHGRRFGRLGVTAFFLGATLGLLGFFLLVSYAIVTTGTAADPNDFNGSAPDEVWVLGLIFGGTGAVLILMPFAGRPVEGPDVHPAVAVRPRHLGAVVLVGLALLLVVPSILVGLASAGSHRYAPLGMALLCRRGRRDGTRVC